jgi:butyrate kinase
MKDYRQLIINPGSTSSKIAVFVNENPVYTETLRHGDSELARFNRIIDQFGS